MALSPSHPRALWARVPWAVTRMRRLPWHPASIQAPVGSPQQRQIPRQPLRVVSLDVAQAVAVVFDLLAFIGDEGEIPGELFLPGTRQTREGVQVDRETGFHVHGATAVQGVHAVGVGGTVAGDVVGDRNGIQMAGQNHPSGQVEVGARQDIVVETQYLHAGQIQVT